VLELFAAQAAALLANMQTLTHARDLSENLRTAMAGRDFIGQAKGVLIAEGAADADTAFTMLATASMRSNRKLRDVASDVIAAAQQRNRHSTGR
jgi:AmiR/NasT family two-component response regulator